MTTYFDQIKDLSKQIGCSVEDLLAMSRKNDPYYTGAPADLRDAEWFFNEVWVQTQYEQVHLRMLHYWAVSRGIRLPIAIKQGNIKTDEYMNSHAAWQFLCKAAVSARYLGYVSYADIIDNKNPDPAIWFEQKGREMAYEVDTINFDSPHIFRYLPKYGDFAKWKVVVACEKTGANHEILPVCERYHADFLSFQGESSLTSVYEMVKRSIDHNVNTAVLYVSDFDPAGMNMPVSFGRKLQYLQQEYAANRFLLQPVALTQKQVRDLRLPRTPLKDSELRAGKFEEDFGTGGVELDALLALHPGILTRLLTEAILPFYDSELDAQIRHMHGTVYDRVKAEVDAVMANYEDVRERINAMNEELLAIEIETDDLIPEALDIEPEEDFLLDTDRGYGDQTIMFNRFRRGEL